MTLPKIIRKSGPYKTRFGILLENLKPYQKNILLDNPLLKDSAKSDQFVLILFKLANIEINKKNTRKLFFNPYKNTISNYKQIEKDSKLIDWHCAICNDNIKSEISEFYLENFLCNKCKKTHSTKSKFIDARILENSIKFRKHCKKILLKEQRKFINYIKKFKKEFKSKRYH